MPVKAGQIIRFSPRVKCFFVQKPDFGGYDRVSMSIPFIDLATQQSKIKSSLDNRIQRVLAHGAYVNGPEIAELESLLASYVGVKHCIACSSGTDALLMAMMALGLKPGDEVITTPFTFFATAETMLLLGLTPVFVDIDPETFNLDATLVEAAIGPKTKAIVPVSLYGQCADFDAFNKIGTKHGVEIIEDAAQSFGGVYKGKRSCSLSRMAATSFFPAKPLGCYGDGGALFTDDAELAKALKEIREHGMPVRYYHTRLGINGRFDTLQAAVLLAKMEIFEEEVELRQRVAKGYAENLQHLEKEGFLSLPVIQKHNQSVFAQYTVKLNRNRDDVMASLKSAGVPTAVHYPRPLNEQPALQNAYITRCPRSLKYSKEASQRVMSLPFHPYMEPTDQRIVAEALSKALKEAASLT